MADLVAVVGKTSSASEVTEVLNFIAPVRVSDDPPFRRYVGSTRRGIDLLFENDRVISLQIYTQASRSFSACSDELPFGIRNSMSQTDVHQLLGMPVEFSAISSKYFLQEFGIKLVITFNDEHKIKLLSFAPLS